MFPEGDGGDAARFVQEDAAAKLPVDHRRPGDVILFPKRDGGCGRRGLPGRRERLRPGHGPVSGRDGAQKLAREGGARGWLSEPGGIGEQLQLVFGPGDPDVEQPPLLLQGLPLLGGEGALLLRRVHRGKDAVHHVDQDHPVVLQPLAGVDGGQDKGAVGVALRPLHHPLERVQPVQQALDAGGLPSQGEQDVHPGGVGVPGGQVVSVAHVFDNALERGEAAQRGQLGKVGPQGPQAARLPGLDLAAVQQHVQYRRVAAVPGQHVLEHPALEAQVQLVVEAEKTLRVPAVQGKAEHVSQIPHHRAGEKVALPLAAAVGDPFPLQQVDQRQGAVVVAVENGGGPAAFPGEPEQIAVLTAVILQLHHPNGLPLGVVCGHMLGMAALVALDEGVRLCYDGPGGAVVGLHQKHPGLRVDGLELQQGLRPGGPEAIDALVLVADQEQIPASGRQQAKNLVLDLGSVLGLVHAEVGKAGLVVGQQIGEAAQDAAGKDHLVVVVHAAAALQLLPIGEVDGGKIHSVQPDLPDLFIGEQHVLAVGDPGADLLHVLIGGVVAPGGHQLPDQGGQAALAALQLEGDGPLDPGVAVDDGLADAVDGAEREGFGVLRSEEGVKPALHVPGGGYRVGDGEDMPRIYPQTVEHIPQSGDQHGGLAAARNGQQEGGPVHLPHGGLLLGVELDMETGFEFLVGHSVPHFRDKNASKPRL